MELTCPRCGLKYNRDNFLNEICPSVPPDRQQRFHYHKHIFKDRVCIECGDPDDRMTFGF